MRDRRISSVLVEGEPPGILTDRDLRTRVLAEGRGAGTPVAEVASRPVRTLDAGATLFEALVFMLEQGVHHVPLTAAGAITGIVTDTDLLRFSVKTPLYLLRNVERLSAPDDLSRYGAELASMVEAMTWGGLQAAQVGPVVSRLNDALVARLVRLAEEELGPPPAAYAWMVFGSEGRMEQTLLTDQDNALVVPTASSTATTSRPWRRASWPGCARRGSPSARAVSWRPTGGNRSPPGRRRSRGGSSCPSRGR